MSEAADNIEKEAAKAQSTSVDGVTTTRRSVAERIMADRYTRDVKAQENGAVGASFLQIVSPGGPR